MKINTNFSPLVLEFDESDKEAMKNKGLEQYFKDLKQNQVFDLNSAIYYNGPAFFLCGFNEIVCYECMEENITDWFDEIECMTFNLEDIERSVICEHCNTLIPSTYGDDEGDDEE